MINPRQKWVQWLLTGWLVVLGAGLAGCQKRSPDFPTATRSLLPLPTVTTHVPELIPPPVITLRVNLSPTQTNSLPTPIPSLTFPPLSPVATPLPLPEAAYANLHAHLHDDSPQLLISYDDNTSIAYTYDNALVILAFLARNNPMDQQAARQLADALVQAQENDPAGDGRVRNAYLVTTMSPDLMIADAGSATGNMAWVALALAQSGAQLGEAAYLDAAAYLGDWIFNYTYEENGYTGGLSSTGEPYTWQATEHNVDVYAAFMLIYQATNDPAWRHRAMVAKRFLAEMWSGDYFWTGTKPDGATLNPAPRPEDTQSWTLLVLGETDIYGTALSWAETALSEDNCPCGAAVGYRFSDEGSGCWWEGAAHIALAWQMLGETGRSQLLMDSLESVALGDIIPAACGETVLTGYGGIYPSDVGHIGATAWYLFSAQGYNPFWGIPITDPVPFAGQYDPLPTDTGQ